MSILDQIHMAQSRHADAVRAAAENGQGLPQTLLQSMGCNPAWNVRENEYYAVLQKYLNQGLSIQQARYQARREMMPIWEAEIQWEIRRRQRNYKIGFWIVVSVFAAAWIIKVLFPPFS